MSKVLSISNKIFSLKGQIFIDDENGHRCYEANGEYSLNPVWTIRKNVSEVATIRKKAWSWSPVWDIESTVGAFQIKRKLFAWTRTYKVLGSRYDGAVVKGDVWNVWVEITHGNQCIASAKSRMLSMRDTHQIFVHDSAEYAEEFTAIVMITLLLDRSDKDDDDDHD